MYVRSLLLVGIGVVLCQAFPLVPSEKDPLRSHDTRQSFYDDADLAPGFCRTTYICCCPPYMPFVICWGWLRDKWRGRSAFDGGYSEVPE